MVLIAGPSVHTSAPGLAFGLLTATAFAANILNQHLSPAALAGLAIVIAAGIVSSTSERPNRPRPK